MPTPSFSTAFAVRGQAFNLSAPVCSQSTGNPILGGLTALSAFVSKDDGTFVATTNAPSERGASGWVSLDLTASEMTAFKVDVQIMATGAVSACRSIVPLDLSGSYAKRYDDPTVFPIKRFEQMLKNAHSYLWNRVDKAGAQLVPYNDDGAAMGNGTVTEGDVAAFKSKIT